MLKRARQFQGGYRFKNYINQAEPEILEEKTPSQVIIPLRQGFSIEVKPLVKKGDKVFAGQIIARDDASISSPVHSSINGVVEDIKAIDYLKHKVSAVVIKASNSSQEISRLPGYSAQWQKLSSEKIEELIYLSGASSLGKSGIPTRFKSSIISPEDAEHLIIHAVGAQPYNISLELLLKDNSLVNFFEGIKILNKVMPKAKVHLAVNAQKKELIGRFVELSAQLDWLDIYPLDAKYPAAAEEILVTTLLNRKFPYGYSAANIGVVVLDIQAVLGVSEAVIEGKPLIEKTIALCGPSFKENTHLKVRVGTSLNEIVNERLKIEFPQRVILNSLLMGINLNDLSLPVDRTFSEIIAIPENKEREFLAFLSPGVNADSYTRAFLAQWLPGARKSPDSNQHGEERPCISCGYCEEVCPVKIIPHLLSKHVEREIIDEKLVNYGIYSCIECGLCNFVCPSKILLLQHIKKGQQELAKEGLDRDKCVLPGFELKGLEELRSITKK